MDSGRSDRWSALLIVLFFCAPAWALPDTVERPAAKDVHAAKSAVFMSVARAGSRIVAVGERGIIMTSSDDGRHWEQSDVPTSVTLTQVHFATPTRGWAVGHRGVILRTDDGGLTWARQFDGVSAAKAVLEYYQGKAITQDGQSSEDMAKRVRAAQRLLDEGADKPFLDVYFADANTGYVVGAYNLIFRTVDAGKTWSPWQDHLENPGEFHLHAIRNCGTSWFIAGEQGLLLRSVDDGATFQRVSFPYSGSLFGLVATQSCKLTAYGLRGNAYQSTDHGLCWDQIEGLSQASILGGAVLDGTTYLLDQAGEIAWAPNSSTVFAMTKSGSQAPLTGVLSLPDGSLILTSANGILRMNNPRNTAMADGSSK